MASQRLHLPRLSQFSWASLTQPNPSQKVVGIWLALSFGFGLFYSFLALQQAFAGPFIVQDDARQHVFWMQRFLDPELFQNDLIADYFQSVAPWGYRLLYQVGAWFSIPPFTFNKLLPLPITLVITLYCFRLTMALLPVPFAAFTSTVLLNQTLWMNSDVASATPRAFIYPLLVAFLYYLVQGSLLPCLITLLLQGLFYPQTLLLSLGVLTLRMLRWRQEQSFFKAPWKKLTWSDRQQRRFSLIAFATAFAILLIYALQSSAYGPTISKAEALQLPEFFSGGRSSFFSDDFVKFWFQGRSGIYHRKLLTPATQALALLLPFFFLRSKATGKPRLALLQQTQKLGVLTQLTLTSVGMFFIAHALLFKLHLPSRYVQHSLRIVLAIGSAILITSWIDSLIRWAGLDLKPKMHLGKSWVGGSLALLLMATVAFYPLTLKSFLSPGYVTVGYHDFYRFMAQQPKDSVMASLSRRADNVGSLAARSVFASREHSIPYHTGYYGPLRDRLQRLIAAQYAPDLAAAQTLIREAGITHWLLDGQSFNPEALADDDWLLQYQPEMDTAIASLQSGQPVALAEPALHQACAVFNQEGLILLDADCLLQQPSGG